VMLSMVEARTKPPIGGSRGSLARDECCTQNWRFSGGRISSLGLRIACG
jgi:hypothetical protein